MKNHKTTKKTTPAYSIYVLYILLSILVLLTFCACTGEYDDTFLSARKLKRSQVYAHVYSALYDSDIKDKPNWKNSFFKKTEETGNKLIEILERVELIAPFDESEEIDYMKGDPFILIEKGNTQYVFYFYDVYSFTSIHNKNRYTPFLWAEKTVTDKDGNQTSQRWYCTMDLDDYIEALNYGYNFESKTGDDFEIVELAMGFEKLYLDYAEAEDESGGECPVQFDSSEKIKLLKEKMLRADNLIDRKELEASEVTLFNCMPCIGADLEGITKAADHYLQNEIIEIIMKGKRFREDVSLTSFNLIAGGVDEPYFSFVNGDVEYNVYFTDGKKQMEENYLYHDEPVILLRRNVIEEDDLKYKWTINTFSTYYILPPEDFARLYEIAKHSD